MPKDYYAEEIATKDFYSEEVKQDYFAQEVVPFFQKPSFAQRARRFALAGSRKVLTPLAWPWQRVEYGLATPLKALQEGKGILPATKTGIKSFIPFTHIKPEEVKTFNDIWAGYWEAILPGSKAPEWYKNVGGVPTYFAIAPTVIGKFLKYADKMARQLPFVQRMAAQRLPKWQLKKMKVAMEKGVRTKRAKEIGQRFAGEEVNRLAKELNTTPEAVKLRLGQILKGSITEQERFKQIANPAIAEFAKTSEELTRLGILPKETYITKLSRKRIGELFKQKTALQKQLTKLKTQKYISKLTGKEIQRRFPGKAQQIRTLQEKIDNITDKIQTSYKLGGTKYMPRMYLTKEQELLARRFPLYSPKKIRAQYAKARKPIPPEVRKAMGEIQEPAYPVTKRLIQEGSDIETSKLFKFAARHKEWVGDTWRPGLVKKALPDTKSYGVLRNRFVAPQIYDDVTQLMRIRNDFEALYDSIIGSWKLGKVVLNPATHFRNMFSNSILLDLSGMSHGEQTKYLMRAIKEVKANSLEYQTAKNYFARTTVIKGELLDDMLKGVKQADGTGLQRTINGIRNISTKVTAKPADVYQTEEFLGKFMKYLQQRDLGKSVTKSVMEGNKWLFDYGDLAGWEKKIMRRLMPFYTFPRKALPRILEAAITRPYTLAKYPIMTWTLEKYSLYKLNLTDKDYEEIKKTLPEYMQRGSYILMPYRDNNGDLRFLDWTYLVPWGELYEVQQRGVLGEAITNPILQLWADLSRNKSGWTGQPIYKDTDTPQEQTFKKMAYIWQAAVPSLMYKGIYWDKLLEAATGKPSKYKKVRALPETIAHTIFGVRTQPIDIQLQKRWQLMGKRQKIGELQGKMRDIVIRRNAGNITQEEYNKKRKQYMKQILEAIKKK